MDFCLFFFFQFSFFKNEERISIRKTTDKRTKRIDKKLRGCWKKKKEIEKKKKEIEKILKTKDFFFVKLEIWLKSNIEKNKRKCKKDIVRRRKINEKRTDGRKEKNIFSWKGKE